MKVLRDVTDPFRQERELRGVRVYEVGKATTDAAEEDELKSQHPRRSAPGFHDSVIQTMVMTDHRSGAKLATNVKTKDTGDKKICKAILKWLQELDYGRVAMKYDDERRAY